MTTKMKMNWEQITPARASEHLSRLAAGQRKRMSRHVNRLAADMKDGNWHDTHVPIAFNCDGSLKDGQHRLAAVVASNTTQWFWVCRGLPNESMDVIDTGANRTIAQAMHMKGDTLDHKDVATATRMMLSVQSQAETITRSQIIAFCEKHRDAILFSKRATSSPTNHACIRAVVSRAWYTESHERLTEFLDAISSQCVRDESDNAAILIVRLMNDKRNRQGGRETRLELYRKVESALTYFLARRPMAKVYGVASEQFPLPEETQ